MILRDGAISDAIKDIQQRHGNVIAILDAIERFKDFGVTNVRIRYDADNVVHQTILLQIEGNIEQSHKREDDSLSGITLSKIPNSTNTNAPIEYDGSSKTVTFCLEKLNI